MLHGALKKYWASTLVVLGLALIAPWLHAQSLVVSSIHVTGIKKTKEKVILRVLTLEPGDTLSAADIPDLIDKNTSNLYNLSIFTRVEIKDSVAGDSVSFHIRVQERWYIWPNPYIAFEERTFAEWWQDKDLDRLVYGGGVTFDNFTGWNDRLLVYGQLGYSRRISVSYSRPFLFPRAQIDFLAGCRYINNKEIGYGTEDGILQLARLRNSPMRRSIDVYAQFGKRFSPRTFFYVVMNYQYFRPNDSIVYFNDEYLTTGGNSEYYPSLSLSFLNDQRDWRAFPLKGYKYSAVVRQCGLPGLGTTTFTKMVVAFSQHLPLSKRWNFAWGTQGNLLLGKRAPYFDKFFIGLDNFIRGYEYYVIDGSAMNITKTELKFAIIPRTIWHWSRIPFRKFQDFPMGLYLSAFCDAGYVYDGTFNNHDNYLKKKLLAGYGVGVNLITFYDKLLRVEFSMNRMGGYGINFYTLLPIR